MLNNSDVCDVPFAHDRVTSTTVDLRFRTFIQQLDPQDIEVQACFRSLVNVSSVLGTHPQASSGKLTRRMLTEPI